MFLTLDRAKGDIRKADGMQLALDFAGLEWAERIVAEFRAWAAEQKAAGFTTVTIEAFRAQTLTQPSSAKAWGSVPGLLCKAGIVAPNCRPDGSAIMVNAAAPRTHGHPIRTWRLL